MMKSDAHLPVISPEVPVAEQFKDAKSAVARLQELYDIAVQFLTKTFAENVTGARPDTRFRAFYPEIRITTSTYAQTDSRLSFGHVAGPGTYSTTVTRPDLFEGYLEQQIGLLIENHAEPIVIGVSSTPMPVHFAVSGDVEVPQEGALQFTLRDVFDVPDLATTNDDIVNGVDVLNEDGSSPLAPFTAQRIDY
jgi:AMP nucleosidase